MKLRRFSQLGWHGCMDLVAAAAGHHVVRVELGEPPKKDPDPSDMFGAGIMTDGHGNRRMVTTIVPGSRVAGKTEKMRVLSGRRWGMT